MLTIINEAVKGATEDVPPDDFSDGIDTMICMAQDAIDEHLASARGRTIEPLHGPSRNVASKVV